MVIWRSRASARSRAVLAEIVELEDCGDWDLTASGATKISKAANKHAANDFVLTGPSQTAGIIHP
jgi:hypothetical protein